VSVWDNTIDAAQFMDLLSQTADHRFGASKVHGTWTRGTRTVTVTPANVQGHPAVLYVDTPRPISRALLDTTALAAAPER
jgi:hypothetical protein